MTPDNRKTHWQGVYRTKAADTVSWYQPSPLPSLEMVAASDIDPSARVVDIGAGASSFVDALLDRGFTRITVLDIAEAALDVARARLGARATLVDWTVADVRSWQPGHIYDLWHDRAVFHFLTDATDRAAYKATMTAALPQGGMAILATFAEDGPERCSGLPVRRYSAADLVAELGENFSLVVHKKEKHLTPAGAEQSFTWALFRRDR